MSNFDWKSEDASDDVAWESAEQPNQPRIPRRLLNGLIVLLIIGTVMGSYLWVQRRTDATFAEAEAQIVNQVGVLQAAIAASDVELALNLISDSRANDEWREQQRRVLAGQLWADRPTLGLTSAEFITATHPIINNRLTSAVVTATYKLQTDSQTTVELKQIHYFDQADGTWQLAQPDSNWLGPEKRLLIGETLNVTYPTRDADVIEPMTEALSDLVTLNCPPAIQQTIPCQPELNIIFSSEPLALVALEDWQRHFDDTRELVLPTPSLVGRTNDPAAHAQIQAAYLEQVVRTLLGRGLAKNQLPSSDVSSNAQPCCPFAALLDVLIEEEMARLGYLESTDSSLDYQRLLADHHKLEQFLQASAADVAADPAEAAAIGRALLAWANDEIASRPLFRLFRENPSKLLANDVEEWLLAALDHDPLSLNSTSGFEPVRINQWLSWMQQQADADAPTLSDELVQVACLVDHTTTLLRYRGGRWVRYERWDDDTTQDVRIAQVAGRTGRGGSDTLWLFGASQTDWTLWNVDDTPFSVNLAATDGSPIALTPMLDSYAPLPMLAISAEGDSLSGYASLRRSCQANDCSMGLHEGQPLIAPDGDATLRYDNLAPPDARAIWFAEQFGFEGTLLTSGTVSAPIWLDSERFAYVEAVPSPELDSSLQWQLVINNRFLSGSQTVDGSLLMLNGGISAEQVVSALPRLLGRGDEILLDVVTVNGERAILSYHTRSRDVRQLPSLPPAATLVPSATPMPAALWRTDSRLYLYQYGGEMWKTMAIDSAERVVGWSPSAEVLMLLSPGNQMRFVALDEQLTTETRLLHSGCVDALWAR